MRVFSSSLLCGGAFFGGLNYLMLAAAGPVLFWLRPLVVVNDKRCVLCSTLLLFLQRLREKWVDVAQAKILQERITECYLRSSVNHLEECKPLVKQYFSLIRQPTFGIRKQGGAPSLPQDTWAARFRRT